MQNKTIVSAIAALSVMGVTGAQAAQVDASANGYALENSASTSGNNFTMLTPGGGLQGGNNTTDMTWDGTVFTENSDYTGIGTTSNMTLSSTTAFSGFNWTAHGVQVFAPGSYTFDATIEDSTTTTPLNMTVDQGQLGAHMLFDWGLSARNIDVAVVWDANGVFQGDQTLTGTKVFDAVSRDDDGNGNPGIPMVDGPFAGFEANFNLDGITPDASPVPVPAAAWLFGTGLVGLAGVGRRRKNA